MQLLSVVAKTAPGRCSPSAHPTILRGRAVVGTDPSQSFDPFVEAAAAVFVATALDIRTLSISNPSQVEV
jgi:hypothetical protein